MTSNDKLKLILRAYVAWLLYITVVFLKTWEVMLKLAFLFFPAALHAHSFVLTVVNNSTNQTIWPAIEGTGSYVVSPSGGRVIDNSRNPLPDGLALEPKSQVQIPLTSFPWSGRVWARQYCTPDGSGCILGDCGHSSCWGRSSTGTTLFEITILHDKMFYDISLGRSAS